MRTTIIGLFLIMGLTNLTAQNLIQQKSNYSSKQTMTQLKASVEKRGLSIFNEINHSEQAAKHELELTTIKVLMFGNPKMGTKLMQADPRIGLELPLKIVVYETDQAVFLNYRDPQFFADQYELGEAVAIVEKMKSVLAEISAEACGSN